MYGAEVAPSLIVYVTEEGGREPAHQPALGQELEPADAVLRLPPRRSRGIYTTNVIESVNMRLRKLTKSRASFPSDEALTNAVVLGCAQHQPEVDHAHPGLEGHTDSISIQFGDRLSVN